MVIHYIGVFLEMNWDYPERKCSSLVFCFYIMIFSHQSRTFCTDLEGFDVPRSF